MDFFVVLVIYMIYFLLMIVASYYVHLFSIKEEYTKAELKNCLPQIGRFFSISRKQHQFTAGIIAASIASLLGMIIPVLADNWLFNSSMLFVVFFFAVPLLKKNLEESKVNTAADYKDALVNICIRHTDIILAGFGAGQGASVLYRWVHGRDGGIAWFLLNMVINTILMQLTIKKIMQK